MSIQLKPVSSSQIKAIGYDPATKTLAIQFKDRKPIVEGQEPNEPIYQYSGFSEENWKHLNAAKSVGSHFYAHIKGRFPYQKQ